MIDLVIEKNYIRELKIIKKLLKESDWVSIEDLAKLNSVVAKTTIQDLEKIKRILPEKWILQIENRSARILKEKGLNYAQIYKVYLRQSFSYQFLTRIFRSSTSSLLRLCNEMYISQSHFYKKVKQLRKYLPDNIQVNLNTLTLEGDEMSIRLLFFQLLSLSNNYQDFGINSIDLQINLQIINSIANKLDIRMTEYAKELCQYWMAICNRRFLKRSMINENKKLLSNPISDILNTQYKEEFNIHGMIQESRVYSLGFYMQSIKYTENSKKLFSDFYRYNNKYYPIVYKMGQTLTKRNKSIEKQQLIINMVDILIAMPILTESISISTVIMKDLNTKIDEYLEEVLDKYISMLEKENTIFLKKLEKEYFIKSLITFYKPMIRSLLPKVKVVLALNLVQGLCLEQDIMDKIRARYSFWAEVHPVSYFEKGLEKNIDLYITNTTSQLKEGDDTHTIYWEFYPVREDWEVLDREIEKYIIDQFNSII
ncbi:helix-turn-helix domain-containing protein [Enterococcus avium]|uniref:helix-turn-helix domain-containing protein n=1 Tax=Enterococcus avium TaxID=33945 RepID=UPI001F588AE3|nr:helix-turn-helix domain-containing protein [Enterococcus avium]